MWPCSQSVPWWFCLPQRWHQASMFGLGGWGRFLRMILAFGFMQVAPRWSHPWHRPHCIRTLSSYSGSLLVGIGCRHRDAMWLVFSLRHLQHSMVFPPPCGFFLFKSVKKLRMPWVSQDFASWPWLRHRTHQGGTHQLVSGMSHHSVGALESHGSSSGSNS